MRGHLEMQQHSESTRSGHRGSRNRSCVCVLKQGSRYKPFRKSTLAANSVPKGDQPSCADGVCRATHSDTANQWRGPLVTCTLLACGCLHLPSEKTCRKHDLKIAGNASSNAFPREAPMHLSLQAERIALRTPQRLRPCDENGSHR